MSVTSHKDHCTTHNHPGICSCDAASQEMHDKDEKTKEALRTFGWLRPDGDGVERMHETRDLK